MFKKLKFGKTTFVVQGVNFLSLLQTFEKEKIKIYKIARTSDTQMIVVCKYKDAEKALAILKEKCYNVLEQKNNTVSAFLRNFAMRTGLIVGLGAGLLLNIIASFFVWNITLYGDGLDSEILSALKTNGVGVGTLKGSLSEDEIEQILYENVEKLSLVDATFYGCNLVINYTAVTSGMEEDTGQTNIVAKTDGIISSITVLEGTALVKINDYVQKGQVLIAGYTEEDGEITECQAKGQVYAYTFKSATVEFPLEKVILTRTGNFVTNTKVTFLGSTVFDSTQEHNFSKFESESQEEYLTPSSALPLKIIYERIYELEEIVLTQDFEANQSDLELEARLLALAQVEADDNIIEEKAEINFVSNVYFVSYYIKIREKIS